MKTIMENRPPNDVLGRLLDVELERRLGPWEARRAALDARLDRWRAVIEGEALELAEAV
jgi:hypothetical protein